jgi:hypothetical protein
MIRPTSHQEDAMASRQPNRTCPAPKPFGKACGHRLDSPARYCEAHADGDPLRQCAQELPRQGGRVRCAAWPVRGLPYCRDHDPVTVALRREEQQSARLRIARVREALARAPVLIQDKMLDLLVAERQVDVGAVEAVARRYHVLR